MRNVCLTMRHKKGILESDMAKAQLIGVKNYSIRNLNYIYPFFLFSNFSTMTSPRRIRRQRIGKSIRTVWYATPAYASWWYWTFRPRWVSTWATTTTTKDQLICNSIKTLCTLFACENLCAKFPFMLIWNFQKKTAAVLQRTLVFQCISPGAAGCGFCKCRAHYGGVVVM